MRTTEPHHIPSINPTIYLSALTCTAAKSKNVLQFHHRSTSNHSKPIFPPMSTIGSQLQDGDVLRTLFPQNVTFSIVFYLGDVCDHERGDENGPHDLHSSCSPPYHSHSDRCNSRSHLHLQLDKQAPGHGQHWTQSCKATILNKAYNASRKDPLDSQGH